MGNPSTGPWNAAAWVRENSAGSRAASQTSRKLPRAAPRIQGTLGAKCRLSGKIRHMPHTKRKAQPTAAGQSRADRTIASRLLMLRS